MATRDDELKTLNAQLNDISLNLSDDANLPSRNERLLLEVKNARSKIDTILWDMDQSPLTEVIDEMFVIFQDLNEIDLVTLRSNFRKWIDRPEQKGYYKELKGIQWVLNDLYFN